MEIILNKSLVFKSFLVFGATLIFFSGCEANVCFRYLGCFSQHYPWVSPVRPFPEPDDPKKVNVSLIFFSREQTVGQWLAVYPNITFNITGFSPNRRTVTITHGFASSALVDWVKDMKNQYLRNIDANIFLVNWEKGAEGINYFQAAANTRVAGAIVGRFGRYLIEQEGVSYSDFHLIGHSLGSHISAYAAEIMNNASSSNQKIYRITGLDPAQPGYQSLESIVRLSKENAHFVEAIHSDAKPFIPLFGFGYLTSIGDVDFFLNRGYNQPKCIDLNPFKNLTSITQLANVTVEVISKAISCSHGRAYEVFTSSINLDVKCKFVGHRLITRIPIYSNQASCGKNETDCITMGLDTPNQKPRGSFQVVTSGKKPYCCYNYNIITGCSSNPKNGTGIFG